jgi:hypothetical protein
MLVASTLFFSAAGCGETASTSSSSVSPSTRNASSHEVVGPQESDSVVVLKDDNDLTTEELDRALQAGTTSATFAVGHGIPDEATVRRALQIASSSNEVTGSPSKVWLGTVRPRQDDRAVSSAVVLYPNQQTLPNGPQVTHALPSM